MLASRPPSVLAAAAGPAPRRPALPAKNQRRRRPPMASSSPGSSSSSSKTAPETPAPAAATQKPDPWRDVPPTEYRDSWLDGLLIGLFTRKLAAAAGVPATVPPTRTQVIYDDFVRVARDDIMGRSRLSPKQQRAMVRGVLLSLMPPGLPAAFRALFPPTQLSAELNARIAAATFRWLVGDMELREGEVVIERRLRGDKPEPSSSSAGAGQVVAAAAERAAGGAADQQQQQQQRQQDEEEEVRRVQRSIVHIKRCRFLEASACAGACVQMCKLPTQEFFAQEFGLPLTMTPNFDDLSCDMVFGQLPLPADRDPAMSQPCFAVQCPTAAPAPACPQVLAAAGLTAGGAGGGGGGGSASGGGGGEGGAAR